MKTKLFSLFCTILSLSKLTSADVPSNLRSVEGNSSRLISVCNATYCDTITRVEPRWGTFITYTTSLAGSRFLKGIGRINNAMPLNVGQFGKVFELQPTKTFQTIIGFGGAATDSTGINWRDLPEEAQKKMVDAYFSEDGLEYSMIRVPIASSDFSEKPYYYNEYPKYDKDLTNFTYTEQDTDYKIPFLLEAMEVATEEVFVLATAWSPPQWMKKVDQESKGNRLKEDYYQTYADYYCKFVKLYEKAGVPIWGVTTTNEPIDGNLMPISFGPKDTLGWSTKDMKKWLKNNFGPTLKKCSGKPMKILAVDDQRFMLPIWAAQVVEGDKDNSRYVDGYALHAYSDPIVPGDTIDVNLRHSPNKFVLATEYCEGTLPSKEGPVQLGNWDRGENYALTILDVSWNNKQQKYIISLTNYVGFIDWNMALNLEGGPNWAKNFVDSTIIVNATSGEFYKQPMFYVMGHFSKFVPRGSKRINTVRLSHTGYTPDENNIYDSNPDRKYIYDHVAFLTPKKTIVVIIANYDEEQNAALLIGSQQVTVYLEAHSIVTVEIPYNSNY